MQINWELKTFDCLSVAELYAVMKLRQTVFVVEQNCAYLDADGKDLLSHHLFARTTKGDCVACMRIVAPGISYPEMSIGRVATRKDLRGTGLGRELMRRGMEAAVAIYGSGSIRISAQTYLIRFYESFGFAQLGHEYIEDDIPHIEMLWTP